MDETEAFMDWEKTPEPDPTPTPAPGGSTSLPPLSTPIRTPVAISRNTSSLPESINSLKSVVSRYEAIRRPATTGPPESPRRDRRQAIIKYTQEAGFLTQHEKVSLIRFFANNAEAVATAAEVEDEELKEDLFRSWAASG